MKRYAYIVFDNGVEVCRNITDSLLSDEYHLASLHDAADLTGHNVIKSGIKTENEIEGWEDWEDDEEWNDDDEDWLNEDFIDD